MVAGYILYIFYKLLEVPTALFKILVEAVACGGRGKDNAALRTFCGFADCLLHISRVVY